MAEGNYAKGCPSFRSEPKLHQATYRASAAVVLLRTRKKSFSSLSIVKGDIASRNMYAMNGPKYTAAAS